MKNIVLIIFIWCIAIFLVNKVSARVLSDRTSYQLPYRVPFTFSIAPLLNMDGREYLDIACKGYFVKNGVDLRVFFPLYPLLIRVLSVGCRFNPIQVGLAVSFFSLVGSLYLFWKILDREIRQKSLLLLLLFPTAFFFTTYYTESIFLLLSLLFFWFLEKKKYLYAAIFAGLASATRIVGLALSIPLFYELFKEDKENKKIHLEGLFAPMGLVLYAVYNRLTTGSFFTFITSQKHWDRPVGFLAPFYAIKSQIMSILAGPLPGYDSPFIYPVILIEFAILLYLLVVLFFSYKKIKMSYWLYILGSLVIILFGGILSALPRYALVLFPSYIFLAGKLKGFKYLLYLFISLLGFLFMASLFLRGYWVS